MKKTKIAIINGPNLNMLSMREPEIYGSDSLDDIIKYTNDSLSEKNIKLEWFQSNIEGEIINQIQSIFKANDYFGLIINPAGFTHTSVAIYDALKLLKCPIIEVHLTNTHKREEFRQSKLTSRAASAILEGLGKKAYLIAVNSLLTK